MGHDCGYLALMGGLSTGAEQVYLPEEGISLAEPAGRTSTPARRDSRSGRRSAW